MKKTYGNPVVITTGGSASLLERVVLGGGLFNEDWLQRMISDHPELLPIHDIEPGFGDIVSIAREIPCGHGFIDNLYLTPAGDIVLVETKLWRNVQARREVVAQTLDYVAALTRMDYTAFEAAIRNSQRDQGSPSTLYGYMTGRGDEAGEARFIDAVSKNLKRGRMLAIVAGDGIRQEAEALGALLQSHAGAHFTFALVELATWRDNHTGSLIALPGTLAQTVMIERGIVTVIDGTATITATPARMPTHARSITETMILEDLAAVDPALPSAIEAFLALVEPLGVYAEFKASLNLKVQTGDALKPVALGYVQRNGQLWTDPINGSAPANLALAYNETLSALIGGSVAQKLNGYVTTNGKSAPRVSQLLPAHAQEWANAIRELLTGIERRARESI